MKKKYKVTLSMEIEHELKPGELLEDVLSDKFFEGVESGNTYEVNVGEIQDNFIRMINNYTGEVKQCNATTNGYYILLQILDEEVKSYIDGNFKERNTLEDITFEGNSFYTDFLKNYLIHEITKLKKVMK